MSPLCSSAGASASSASWAAPSLASRSSASSTRPPSRISGTASSSEGKPVAPAAGRDLERRRGRGDVHERLLADVPDRVLLADGDQDERAALDLHAVCFDRHQPTPLDDHVCLLAVLVPVERLLARTGAFDPGHGKPIGGRLTFASQQEKRNLTAAAIARAFLHRPRQHSSSFPSGLTGSGRAHLL